MSGKKEKDLVSGRLGGKRATSPAAPAGKTEYGKSRLGLAPEGAEATAALESQAAPLAPAAAPAAPVARATSAAPAAPAAPVAAAPAASAATPAVMAPVAATPAAPAIAPLIIAANPLARPHRLPHKSEADGVRTGPVSARPQTKDLPPREQALIAQSAVQAMFAAELNRPAPLPSQPIAEKLLLYAREAIKLRAIKIGIGGFAFLLILTIWVSHSGGRDVPAKAVAASPALQVAEAPDLPEAPLASRTHAPYRPSGEHVGPTLPGEDADEAGPAAPAFIPVDPPRPSGRKAPAPPPADAQPAPRKYVVRPGGFRLAGIMQMPNGRFANLNGQYVTVGETVNSARVVNIGEFVVEMERDGEFFLVGVSDRGSPEAAPAPQEPEQPSESGEEAPAEVPADE